MIGHIRLLIPRIACVLALAACEGRVSAPGGGDDPGPAGDPGRVTLHRLNRVEYDNTVRDLLGTSQRPAAASFPADDYGHGFDNIADVLSISPMQAELYQRAAESLAAEAMAEPWGETRHVEAEAATPEGNGRADGGTWVLLGPGQVSTAVDLAEPGTYRIAVRAGARQAGAELARMEIRVDGTAVSSVEVSASASAPAVYEHELELAAGAHTIAAAFVNDYYNPDAGEDRNLHVDWIDLIGPRGSGENPIRDRIMVCQPDPEDVRPCVEQIIRTFGKRAWRRPLITREVEDLARLVDVALAQGEDIHRGLQLAVEAILSSPHFIFRFEIDPDPTSAALRPLNDYELASRLSYFLWSTMPDDELFELADQGLLRDRAVLAAQIDRMLADPKASALADNFAGQWINTRGLRDHQVDYAVFPTFDDQLRADMIEETRLFFQEFLTGDRPITEMLTADFTYVSPRLAAHYGLEHPGGEGFARVRTGGQRRGLLGQGSVLTVTSYPTRTSPVKRGKWVLEQLLCSAPPPPPPGVEGLDNQVAPNASIRERMEQHRSDPVCASCHAAMDPIGFALEHFDGIGAWRDVDGPFEIDATGTLPDGQTFDGAAELAEVLAADPRLPRCLTEKMLIYATGRGLEEFDRRTVDRLTRAFVERGMRLRDLIHLIATSDPFLYRRGEPAGGEP